MLDVGSIAPDFTLPDQHAQPFHLHDALAHAPIVLYFYPADFTRVCTTQACMFRDAAADIVAAGLRVVGVSPQSVESHARFAHEYRLTYPLLADDSRSVAKQYRVAGVLPFLPFGIRRTTYLISRDGRIADALTAHMSVAAHRSFLQGAIALSKAPRTLA